MQSEANLCNPTQDFANSIKDNPQAIIEWAESEIREYQKLIKILREQK